MRASSQAVARRETTLPTPESGNKLPLFERFQVMLLIAKA